MRALGWKKDFADTQRLGIEHIRGRVSTPHKTSTLPDLRQFRGPALEQGTVSACVAFAISRAIRMSLVIQGHANAPCPAPLFTYYAARRQEYAGIPLEHIPDVQDVGCYPNHAMVATQNLGFIPWESWPFTDSARNTTPPPDLIVEAYPQKELAWYSITSRGTVRLDELSDALRMGYPAIFGMQVDHAFLNHNDQSSIRNIDWTDIAGGHMMAILAFDEIRHSILVDNWWGPFWGGNGDGTGWIDADLFSDVSEDLYAVVAAPLYQ